MGNKAPIQRSKKKKHSFLGFQELALMSIEDKSKYTPNPHTSPKGEQFEVCLVFQFSIKDNDYPQDLWIVGNYDRSPDGDIILDQPLLKKIFSFFDAFDYQGTVACDGTWLDDSDDPQPIKDNLIGIVLEQFIGHPLSPKPEDYKYYGYLYKQWNEKHGKAFTNIYPRLWKNIPGSNNHGRGDAESHIEFMKKNKYIVEHEEGPQKKKSSGSIEL